MLDAARLNMIVPALEDFGVEDVEDLSFVEDTSLAREGIKEVPRRRFHAWIARLGGDIPPPPRDTSPRVASARRDPASDIRGNCGAPQRRHWCPRASSSPRELSHGRPHLRLRTHRPPATRLMSQAAALENVPQEVLRR